MKIWKNRLKNLLRVGMSAAMITSFCVVSPNAALAVEEGSQTAASADSSSSVTSAPSNVETSDYTNQYFADLLSAGQLSASSNVTLQTQEGVDGVLVSGPANDLASAGITVSKQLNFDDGAAGRVRVEALTERKTSATLECYLDDETMPIASFKLRMQKKASSWDTEDRDYCVDISSRNLTGTHTFTFKVTGASAEQPKVLLKSFELMKFTVPVVDFHIDEELGSVDAMNASASHSVECYGSIDINVPSNYTSSYTGEQLSSSSYELDYVRGRGNSTWAADTMHRPYKLKLDKKADLLGMGANKHWVLIANYYDNSQLRNKITYWLSEQLGFEYTVKLEPVEVIMNGEYYGSYYLCEQVRVGENRLDIDDLEDTPDATDEDTISGGYLLNLEGNDDANQSFASHGGEINWTIESPKFDGYFNESQYNYIKNYIEETEEALYSDTFTNSLGKSYTDYLDLQSAIDYLWVQEFSMNGDAYVGGSNYLYKKRNGKLYFGPLWDFDYVAWGSTEYSSNRISEWQQRHMWVSRLMQDEQFASLFIQRWQTLKTLVEEITCSGGKLDQFASRITTAVNYNIEKYGMTQMAYDTGDEGAPEVNLTFAQEVERLRSWIEQRESWGDSHIAQRMPVKCSVTYKAGDEVLEQEDAYVGDHLELMEESPSKEGSTFVGWQLSYHIDYERYLKVNKLTEDELVEQVGAEEAANIKENGYSYSGIMTENDYDFLIPCDLTFTAVFKGDSSGGSQADATPTVVYKQVTSNSLLGRIVTKKGVRYQVTSVSAKTGRSVKVAGIANAKKKQVVIPKSIKIKGKKYAVTEIGAKAFAGCKKLACVVIKGKGLYVRNATFKALPKKAVVKVPSSAVMAYSSAISCRTVKAL